MAYYSQDIFDCDIILPRDCVWYIVVKTYLTEHLGNIGN